ncbi:MAG: hypothetical protein QM724_07665 [Flavobacteriales bacterium]
MIDTTKWTALGLVALAFVACKKDSDDSVTPSPTHEHHHATVKVGIAFRTGGNVFTLDSVLTDGDGHKLKLTKARFFLSNAYAIDDADATVGEFPHTYILASASTDDNTFELGEIEAGHVHALVFAIGLDSATNHSDPTQYTTFPLNDASMHWSWNADVGYKFVELEGLVDDDGDGVVDDADPGFLFHCAGDALLTPDTAHVHHTLVEGEVFTVQLQVHMDQLFNGMNLLSYPMEMGATTGTRQVVRNLAAALDSEH